MNQKICRETEEKLPSSKNIEKFYNSFRGLIFALIVLIGNGIHTIINNLCLEEFSSLLFLLQM